MHQHPVDAPAPNHPPRRRIHGLAGLAALTLIATALGAPLPGGNLAVDVLLVAVGFDLARTVRGHSHIADRASIHRWGVVGRFVPITVMVVILTAIRAAVFDPGMTIPADRVLSSTAMMANVHPVVAAGGGPLDHLWLVAAVFQFSIVAPTLVLAGRTRFRPETRAALVAALAAACFTSRCLAVFVGAPPGFALQLLRLDGLLLGLAVGMVPLSLLRRPGLARLGTPAIVLIGLAIAFGPRPVGAADGGSLQLTVGLSGLVVVAAGVWAGASSNIARTGPLDALPFRWLGERAVGLHVWHVLFGLLLGTTVASGAGSAWPGFPLFMVRLIFCLAAAAISHRLIEQPFRIAFQFRRKRVVDRNRRHTSRRRHPTAPNPHIASPAVEGNRRASVGRPASKTL